MNDDLVAWLSHPVTLGLGGLVLMVVFAVIDLLLRTLGELGNVRFQGILGEHPGLLGGQAGVHVSRLADVLRWLQLGCVGLLWLVVFRVPGLGGLSAVVVAAAVPMVLMALVRVLFRPLSEDAFATLLRLLRPLAAPLIRLSPAPKAAVTDVEEEEATEAEIQAYLAAGEAAGIFEGGEGEYVESLVDFFDTVVREVMTPRTEMVTVADTDSYRRLLEVFAETRKSRIPVYHETVDRIIGVAHVKSLVAHLLRGEEPPIADLARECPVVPESKELGELLSEFQQQHQQMAIVVDEYGGTSGLVTLEDIIEEIVGEIRDEHDAREPPEWQELAPGRYRLQGRASLEVLKELFGIEVEEGDVDTVGGLVFSRWGTVPEPDTEVEDPIHGLRFKVEVMDERRIVSVTVQRIDGSQSTTGP